MMAAIGLAFPLAALFKKAGPPFPSSRRRPGPSASTVWTPAKTNNWVPAFAGMTGVTSGSRVDLPGVKQALMKLDMIREALNV